MRLKHGLQLGLGAAAGGAAFLATKKILGFQQGRALADDVWHNSRYPKMETLGTVKRLSILPLIDWYTSRPDFEGEPGVSYLIRADDTTILFDVGFNANEEHPSPLLRNMDRLGLSFDDIDFLVFSHAHVDHLGGMTHAQEKTFAPTGNGLDLAGKTAYVPEPLSNPTANSVLIDAPRVLAPGVASMGPIARQLFFLGWTPEQSLAVHVAGKGMVLIIGCGHPTLERIIDRSEMLFDAPLHGLVGGLHYPVTESRAKKFGLQAQMIFGTGKYPWQSITKNEVEHAISYLQARNPQLVSLSPHDSCDWSLSRFRQAFPQAYQPVLVGQEIVISA